MSVKSELKTKYQQSKLKQEQEQKENEKEEEKELQAGVRNFIEDFIIPTFREIYENNPTTSYLHLRIDFTDNIDYWRYTLASKINFPYTYETVSAAVKLAKEFEIEASEEDDGADGTSLSFWVDLKKSHKKYIFLI